METALLFLPGWLCLLVGGFYALTAGSVGGLLLAVFGLALIVLNYYTLRGRK
jgi:hypothetical protein